MEHPSNPLLRRVASGWLEGIRSPEHSVLCWLGIPYAAPPVGPLRWRAPQDPIPWEGIRPAKQFGPVSVQKQGTAVVGSEDCLYLNVFRPDTQETLPVFFFIHGGNNQTDSGQLMDGPLMADALHAVVVTINLRLGALGWLNIKAIRTGDPLEDSGNFGLLDIKKSLSWVHENIQSFGGDAGNLTVCGYSSGSRDLLCMLISPLFRGSFSRAVTFSGGFTTTDPEKGASIATKALARLVVEDGKAPDLPSAAAWLDSASPEVRDYLMGVDALRFGPLMAGAAIRMAVFPHLFADGATIPKEGFQVLARGESYQVPMMVLSGGHEFTANANSDPAFQGADFTDPQVVEEYRFVTRYGSALFGYINGEQNAKAFSAQLGQPPVYAGRCLWGMNPEVTGELGSMRMGGAHGLDLFLTMGIERPSYAVTPEVFTSRNRPGREALAQVYRQYLSNFVHTGDPNGAGLPQWEPWDNREGGPKLLLLDADNTAPVVRMTADWVEEEKIFQEILADCTLPEDRKTFLMEHVLNGRFFSDNLDPFWVKAKQG